MKKNYYIQFFLIILATILYVTANIQRVAVPGAIFDVLQSDLNINPAIITALGSSFMYVYAICQLIIGMFVSKFGGHRIILAGAIIFSIGCLMFPLVNSPLFLYISRALVGMGAASFYLGIIEELQKTVKKNNFGIILSIILFVGYIGGIVANLPLVLCVREIGWRNTFLAIGIFIFIVTFIFFLVKNLLPVSKINKSIKFDWSAFKKILSKKNNIILYVFAFSNYSLYYILQTVIGKKFLEDFCEIQNVYAALILSIMATIYAISGPFIAFLSKNLLNRKTIFFHFSAINAVICYFIILFCLIFNMKLHFIAYLYFFIAFFAPLVSLTVPLLTDMNSKQHSSITVCIITSSFYLFSGFLANIIGIILNFFSSSTSQNNFVYSNKAYFAVFFMLFLLALFSLLLSFKIKESSQTLRFIKMQKYLKHKF